MRQFFSIFYLAIALLFALSIYEIAQDVAITRYFFFATPSNEQIDFDHGAFNRNHNNNNNNKTNLVAQMEALGSSGNYTVEVEVAVTVPPPTIDHRQSSSATNTSTTPRVPRDKSQTNTNATRASPSFDRHTGGVVLFYHLYKTGGSTIRDLFSQIQAQEKEQNPDSEVGRFKFRRIGKALEDHKLVDISKEAAFKRRIYFVELHVDHPTRDYPTLIQMEDKLTKWRELCHNLRIPFFSLTLLREPTAFAVSFFNYFHVNHSYKQLWNPYYFLEPTEANLVNSLAADRQCLLLGSNPIGVPPLPTAHADNMILKQSHPRLAKLRMSTPLSPCQYGKVERLLKTLDWVGTTEHLSFETLPILSQLLFGQAKIGASKAEAQKVYVNLPDVKPGLVLNQLSAKTLERIRDKSTLDQQLYDMVRQTFQPEFFGINFSNL